MRILYVARGKQFFSPLKHAYHYFLDLLEHRDQEGFFDASLKYSGGVECISLNKATSALNKKKYDWVIINWKQQGFENIEARKEAIINLLQNSSAHTAVFVSAAQAEYMPPESVLDECNLIFKREPYKDRYKYDISEENKKKIVPTMIHCPFVPSPRDNILSKAYHLLKPKIKPCGTGEEEFEVGFSGADAQHHSLRRDAWERVVDEGFSIIGGLQPNPNTKEPIPEKLQGPRYKGKAYRDSLCSAKINLALDGIGEYTFRHQELLYLGKFILSSPSIRELELPMPLEEGKHYVAFDDLDDMTDKIRYYLKHEDERNKIAKAGRELFDKYYDPKRHGQDILKALESV